MRLDDRTWLGLLLFLGSAQFVIIGLMAAEAVAQTHNAGLDVISELGVGASAPIFNTSVFLLGLAFVAAAYFVRRVYGTWHLALLFLVGGVGAMGVGVFPLTNPVPHSISALIAFVASGLVPIAFVPRLRMPLNALSLILGLTSLVSLVLFVTGTDLGLGIGGIERMIVYPTLVWAMAFGGGLIGSTAEAARGA